MMPSRRILASWRYWRQGLSFRALLRALLGALGAMWVLAELGTFLFPDIQHALQDAWYFFLLCGVAWAFWETRPPLGVSSRLTGRDVTISITVGDLFSENASLIIGSNCSFDTSTDIIHPDSVQGQFTRLFYREVAHLDHDIEKALLGCEFREAPPGKPGKRRIYPLGTVAMIAFREKTVYLVAIASINRHRTTDATFEGLREALAGLWEFISSRGTIGPLAMPVLGSGFSRLTEPREEIIREIVRSFVAACASRRFCDELRIVIPPKDYLKHKIDMAELGAFLSHTCRYTEQKTADETGRGVPVPPGLKE